MNSIKQAKHLNDVILGRYGTLRIWRSGINAESTFTWSAEISVNGKVYQGWGTSEEEARTEAAVNFKEGKWEYDNTGRVSVRYDKSKLCSAIQVSENEWIRIRQEELPEDTFITHDKKKKEIVIDVSLPEPIKNMLLMSAVFKIVNEKQEDKSFQLSEQQIDEFTKKLYPLLSYSGLWVDHISEEELNEYYGKNDRDTTET